MSKLGIILSVLICVFDVWLLYWVVANMGLWYTPIVFFAVVAIAYFNFLLFILSFVSSKEGKEQTQTKSK